MALYSYQVEKHFIGGLIQNPEIFTEVEGFVSDKSFHSTLHGTIYSCFRSAFLNNEKIDKVLLAQKIQNLGIKTDVEIFDYIDGISFTQITPTATIEAASELVKMAALRSLEKKFDSMKETLHKQINEPLEKIVSATDKIYGDMVSSFNVEQGWQPLGLGLLEMVEERGNNPITEIGMATPYAEFNRLYGGLRNKNLYIIAARAKAGKSTLLNDWVTKTCQVEKCRGLILDTEMSREETQWRAASAKSGVPLWYLETGNWRKNPEFVERVRKRLANFEQEYPVDHYYVGNKSIDEIKQICRRWRIKVAGRNNKCLICFDYVKIVEAGEDGMKEYQLMGQKIDMLKKLAEELDCPIISACQNNREGVVGGKDTADIVDDERSIGISDRITWYATGVWIFRRRTPEEIQLDTPESGTHKLCEVVARFQGKDAAGHQNLIKRTFPNGKSYYIKNFINFNIDNFDVAERGSLKDCIRRQLNIQANIQDKDEDQDGGVLVRTETL